jgi:hypothetical protein
MRIMTEELLTSVSDGGRAPAVAGRRLKQFGWGLVVLSAAAIALSLAPRYMTLDPALSNIPLNPEFARHLLWVSLHALPGSLALLIGPFQFPAGFRARRPGWHRVLGRIYLLSVLMAGGVGVVAAFASMSGPSAKLGLLVLAGVWLFTGMQAYRTARARRFDAHRVWMIRNYALTFTAVSLRVFLVVGRLCQTFTPSLSFEEIYTSSIWGSIVVCALVAEWFIVPPPFSRGRSASVVGHEPLPRPSVAST